MYGLLNLGSFVVGLVAWILPTVNLMRFGACATSLSFQIFYHNHLVTIEDWAALMDTTDAVAFATAVLLIGTILLNVMTLFLYRDRTTK